MGKGTEKTEKPVEKEDIQETEVEDEAVEKKVEKKIEQVEKKVKKVGGERENIVNYDVKKPNTDDPDFDFKAWAKSIDEKLEKLITGKKDKEVEKAEDPPTPEPEKKKLPWYERELI